jgi:hypothetical protein
MSTVTEIKAAIERLSLAERAEVARWLNGWEDDGWDRQMSADVDSGRLDSFIKEMDTEIEADHQERHLVSSCKPKLPGAGSEEGRSDRLVLDRHPRTLQPIIKIAH